MVRGYLKKARLSLGGDNRLLVVLPDTLAAVSYTHLKGVMNKSEFEEILKNLIFL